MFGRAFLDIFDEVVEYHQVPHLPYHSFIRGDGFRIETDAQGRPVLVAVRYPLTKKSGIEDTLILPPHVRRGSLRLLDLRVLYHEESIRVDWRNKLLYIKLKHSASTSFVSTGIGIIWGVDERSRLAGLWITGWQGDPSGMARSRWRRRAWARVHRRFAARRRPGRIISVSADPPKDLPISTIFA